MISDVKVLECKKYLLNLQTIICDELQKLDIQTFITDKWEYSQSGGGQSRVLQDGSVFERAGVNFSHIKGSTLPPSATLQRPELENKPFEAMGLSLVIHPRNPFVPTVHANFRLFVANNIWWFGGGYDLTPYYGFKEDIIHWHQTAYNACAPFGDEIYNVYKKAADDYFYNKHRQEARGVGGLFFDDLNEGSFEDCFALVQSIANSFLTAYLPIVQKRKDTMYTDAQRNFQLTRRGRYVEFNLVYDRGTLFGLQSGGRIESILMSLPPTVMWAYNWVAKKGTPEAELTDFYLKPQNWLSLA